VLQNIVKERLMPPGLVAADLDGTLLLSESHELSSFTKQSVRTLAALGIPTILATGRMFRSARRFAAELGLDGPLIAYQGALIKNVSTGETLHHDPVPLESALEIIDFVQADGRTINVYLDDDLHVEGRTPFVDWYEEVSGMRAHLVGPLSGFLDRPPTKIGLGGEPKDLEDMLPRINDFLRGRATAVKTWPFFIEMTSPTATKSRGLDLVCRQMGLGRRQVLAFGDSHNDSDMLAWAGTGVAMGDAPPEVAALADITCESVDDDGFTRYLERQGWFHPLSLCR
jgi:Cof subfamily protein (haloacid dehalogenase superfamily)